jgi:carbamoyl-phosphate synthase small subunit
MNAMICDRIPQDLSALKAFRVLSAVQSVTCKEKKEYPALGEEKYRVALLDYGAKQNIIRSLQRRGCRVTVWPADTTAEALLKSDPDGVMLSNGPGDPKENVACIEEIKKLLGQKPVFGICLGHQLTALAMGGDTVKLKYGHRGGNQPVKDLTTGRTWITSQNHGYAVVADSLKGKGIETFANANDGSCEGMAYPEKNCFTVQFHPEACSGPQDTGFLFDRFIAMMGGKDHA